MTYLDDVKAHLDAAAASVASAQTLFDANQPTWPVWDHTGVSGAPVFSNYDRTVAANGTAAHILRSTVGLTPARRQIDIYVDAAGSPGYLAVGLIHASQSLSPVPTSQSGVPPGAFLYRSDGLKLNDGSQDVAYGSGFTGWDTVNVYTDELGRLWFGKNGTPIGDPVAGTGEAYSGLSGEYALCAAFFGGVNGPKVTLQHSLTIPLTGFAPWNIQP